MKPLLDWLNWIFKYDWEVIKYKKGWSGGDLYEDRTWVNQKTGEQRRTITKPWF